MARNTTAIRVLIASPSDVTRERDVLADAINRWNAAHSMSAGIVLEAIRWETHAHPAAGDHPQEIINRQIVDDCDVVVGVLWSRLGTPTPKGVSGTAEEIERLRQRGKHVLLYFSSAPIPQDHDPAQFRRLQEYKQSLKEGTLYWQYDSIEHLDRLFSQHLATVINELKADLKAEVRSTTEQLPSLVVLKPLPGPRMVKADDSDTWREAESEERDSMLAAVATFRIEAASGLSHRDVEGLQAQITYYDSNGGELQRVYHGCWLGEPLNHTELSPGDTKELVLALDHMHSGIPLTIENTRSRAADYEHEGTRPRHLERRLYDVNVRLIGHVRVAQRLMQIVADFHFNLDVRSARPILRLEWTK